jgi:hypothetical protein
VSLIPSIGRLALLTAFVTLATVVVAPRPALAADPACPTDGIPFSSRLTNGRVQIGRLDPATGVSATACGVVVFTPELTLEATIPKENLSFSPLEIPLGLLSVPVEIVPTTDFTGPVTFADDGIHIALSGQVVANAEILLSTCVLGPFRSALTTDQSGSLVGRPFGGEDPADLRGQLVGNEDPVPAAKSTWQCPFPVAGLLNLISGLPSPAGESSISFDANLTLSPAAAATLRR